MFLFPLQPYVISFKTNNHSVLVEKTTITSYVVLILTRTNRRHVENLETPFSNKRQKENSNPGKNYHLYGATFRKNSSPMRLKLNYCCRWRVRGLSVQVEYIFMVQIQVVNIILCWPWVEPNTDIFIAIQHSLPHNKFPHNNLISSITIDFLNIQEHLTAWNSRNTRFPST